MLDNMKNCSYYLIELGEYNMTKEEELFTVSFVNCNNQVFQFSRNLLESIKSIVLQCPKCKEDTQVTYDSISGVAIKKY